MYTASFVFFEALWQAGITHCFVNLGSDHPGIIEAMVTGKKENPDKFPRIITCPNEVTRYPGIPRLTDSLPSALAAESAAERLRGNETANVP